MRHRPDIVEIVSAATFFVAADPDVRSAADLGLTVQSTVLTFAPSPSVPRAGDVRPPPAAVATTVVQASIA